MPVLERNSELVLQAFALFERGDIDGLLDLYHPDVVMHASGVLMDRGVYRGRADLGRALERLHASGASREIVEFEAHDSGELVVAHGVVCRPERTTAAWVVAVMDGQIRLIEGYLSASEAWQRAEAGAGEPGHWRGFEGAEAANGVVVARFVDQDVLVLRLDNGRRFEAKLPPASGSRWIVGSAVTVYLDGEGELVGWYVTERGVGVDLRGDSG